MYCPSGDRKMKCYSATGVGSENKLKNALKKLFCDICETLISFQHRLEINGTIGITIDNESVLLLQFSEAFNRNNTMSFFRDNDDDNHDNAVRSSKVDMNNSESNGLTEKIWMHMCHPKSSNRSIAHQSTIHEDSNAVVENDVITGNVSKNSSGYNLVNSSDSNDCLLGFGSFDGNLANNISKSESSVDLTGICDVSETRPARKSSSMLSQLLQRPPSTAEVYGNHVWPAPVSASEMLKKMSSRVVGAGQDGSSKSSSGMKSVCCSSPKTSSGSSYLRELLFQKISGQNVQKANFQKSIYERKRKKLMVEPDSFIENELENGRCSNSHQFPPSNDSFTQPLTNFFSDNRSTNSPNSNPEFSEYRYSMLLHKLVDVRRNQQMDSSTSCDGNSFRGDANTFESLDRRFDGEPIVSDLWSQEIKVEMNEEELPENPKTLIKFDIINNHITENNQDSDAF